MRREEGELEGNLQNETLHYNFTDIDDIIPPAPSFEIHVLEDLAETETFRKTVRLGLQGVGRGSHCLPPPFGSGLQ